MSVAPAAPPTTALAELLRSMADDEFVIGFSDSEWTGIAPLLEEDVAMSSLAQDELGHAAALYGLLATLTGDDPDALAYDREPAEYRHCRLLDHGRGDWAMTIARRFLYDSADAVRLDALAAARGRRSPSSSGSSSARSAITGCTRRRWLDRLARRDGEPRERLLAALETLGPRCRDRVHATPRRAGARPGRHPRRADVRARGALARVDRPVARGVRPADAAARPRPDARAARPRRRRSAGCGASSPRSDAQTRERPGERGRDPDRHRAAAGAAVADAVVRRAAAAAIDLDAVRRALAEVMDPELPMLSVVDLGIVHRLEVDARRRHRSGSRSCRRSSAARRSSSSRRPSRIGLRRSAGRSR